MPLGDRVGVSPRLMGRVFRITSGSERYVWHEIGSVSAHD